MSTETIRLIRDREKGGMEVGEEGDYRPKYSWFLVDKQTDPASVQLSLLFVKSDTVTV